MPNNGGFTLDGMTARQLGFRMLRASQRPILPNTVNRTLAIAGRNGLYYFGADLEARQFDLECAANTTGAVALQAVVDHLAAYLLDSQGKPRPLPLVFDAIPDRTYTVYYSGSLPIDRVSGLGKFTLPLIAFDPHGYADSDSEDIPILYDAGHLYDIGLIYPNPNGFNWTLPEQHSSLYNYSSLDTGIEITITGSVSSPSIKHEQSGETIYLPSISGQTLVVDAGKLTVKLNGTNALPNTVGDLSRLQLVPGDNGFVFRCGSATATVAYSWKIKYA